MSITRLRVEEDIELAPPRSRGPSSDFGLLISWLNWLDARGASAKTVNMYGYGVWRLVEHVRRERFADLEEDDVTAFLATIGTQSAARNLYIRGLRSFFTFAYRRGAIDHNPARWIPVRPPRRRPRVVLSRDELARYLVAAAVRDPLRAWALMLKFATGTRTAELAGIRPDQDLDLEDGLGRVRVVGKGHKERWIELNEVGRTALEELRPWWNGTVLGGMAKQTVTRWATEAAKDAGLYAKLKGRTSHVLRSSYITMLLRAGADVGVVRDLVGHYSIQVTNDYVAEAEPEVRRAAVRLLDDEPRVASRARVVEPSEPTGLREVLRRGARR